MNKWSKYSAALLVGILLLLPTLSMGQTEAYLPTARALYPNINSDQATLVPSSVLVGFEGADPDASNGLPNYIRFMMIPAEFNGEVIDTRIAYENNYLDLINFADERWSNWIPYPENPAQRSIIFPELPDQEVFLLAFQAMDTTGAVSLGRSYGQEVFNFQVRANMFRPQLVINEYYLGSTTTNQSTEIASGQPLNFSWSATADHYNAEIAYYRHGFDLLDPNDVNDPGWAVPAGTDPENLFAQEQIFQEGYHTFTVRVADSLGQVTILTWDLIVIPYVSPEFQLPLLLIDQVVDNQTNQWLGQGGAIAYDREDFRNAFWQFLEGAGGVSGFNWSQDRFDHTEQVQLSDLVNYQTVLVYARSHTQQLMFNEFRPQNGQDQFVWLAPYQQRAGNLFLVGGRSMDSFLEQLPNYMVPLIFQNPQEFIELNGETYVLGFGQTELPDGSLVPRGPRMYPFAAAGISALDWVVPMHRYIYPRIIPGQYDRNSSCAGVKGLVLNPGFRLNHQVGPGALPDTIFTNPLIDWLDEVTPNSASLENPFLFRGDEFVDFNISSNPYGFLPQECQDGPNGLCIEPMFTSLARFDWLRERKWAEGDTEWPQSQYSTTRLEEICGVLSQTTYDQDGITVPLGTARTNGRTVGYFSYKNIQDKPNPKANVYWGFDPYRFDHEQSKQTIRWVLQYFGLNINN